MTYWTITEAGCDALGGRDPRNERWRELLRSLTEWDDGKIPDDALVGHEMETLRMFGYIADEDQMAELAEEAEMRRHRCDEEDALGRAGLL